MKTLLIAAASIAAITAFAGSADASTVVYNFGVSSVLNGVTTAQPGWAGDQGVTATYTIGGLSLTATAYGPAPSSDCDECTPDHLWGKAGGGTENGLGMTNDPTGQHEIHLHDGFVQLDLLNLAGRVNSFMTNSTSDGEAWTVYGTNTGGTHNSPWAVPAGAAVVATGMTQGATSLTTLTGNYRYYDFVETGAGGQNFLITEVTSTAGVPEPVTWMMMIMGFGGVGAVVRRKRPNIAFAPA